MTTGTDVLREALRIRAKKANLGTLARDFVVAPHVLEEFIAGKGNLPSEVSFGSRPISFSERPSSIPRRTSSAPQEQAASATYPRPTAYSGR